MKLTSVLLLGIFHCIKNVHARKVQTTHGPVEGAALNLFNGKSVDAYLGIPYAAPPLGQRRFSAPQPLAPWNTTLNATSFSDSCFQAVDEEMRRTVSIVSNSPENEDCLYLNLWIPKINTTEKLSVMIWIYGGAFVAGSTSIPEYNGAILASENDVIVASMNYRQYAFGFLFLNITEVPGNAAFQDQIQAITWIKNNIEAFGGDPTRITLFGQSAGSIAIAAHLTNPHIHNLFQRAIMMSGPLELSTTTLSEALNNSLQLSENLGCPVSSVQETLDCLRSKPASDFFTNHQSFPDYLKFPFATVNNGINFPEDTSNAAKSVPPRKRIDLIGGNIPGEMSLFMPNFFPGKELTENFTVTEDDLRGLLGILFQTTDKRLQNIILHEYGIYSEMFDKNQFREEAVELLSDFPLLCPQINFTEEWVTNTNRVYYYTFEHRPSKAVTVPMPKWTGPVHGDEIAFVFGLPLDPKNGYTDAEMVLSKKIMRFWTNFAKTGDPNGFPALDTTWPALEWKTNLSYLRINENLQMGQFPKEKKCSFWRDILPLLQDIQAQLSES